MIALVVIALAACLAVAIIQERRVSRAIAERDAAAEAYLDARGTIAALTVSSSSTLTSREALRLLDAHRPIGVSLRSVVHGLSETLSRSDYP